MFSSLTGRIRLGYMTAFGLLFVAYLFIFYSTKQFNNQALLMNEMNESISRIDLVVAQLRDAESEAVKHLIAGNPFSGKLLAEKRSRTDSLIFSIRNDNIENLLFHNQLDTLQLLASQKQDAIDSLLSGFQGELNFSKVKERMQLADAEMDQIMLLAERMRVVAHQHLLDRKKEMETAKNSISIINTTGLVIAVLLAVYAMTTFNQENKEKNSYRMALERKVEDLKKMNQELGKLRSMEKFTASGRIARTIVHEVRNPLTNIGLAGDQLREFVTDYAEANDLLDMINRNVSRINQLVGELLHSTRFAELAPEEISLSQLIDGAIQMANDRIRLKELRLVKEFKNDRAIVRVDKAKMEIALLNIIVNAVEAMPQGKGMLSISTDESDNYYRITIADNGPGMDEDTMSKIFEPYFTAKPRGNGLGLTNTQNIILNHKGTIEVESNPGNGTTFIVSLQKFS